MILAARPAAAAIYRFESSAADAMGPDSAIDVAVLTAGPLDPLHHPHP